MKLTPISVPGKRRRAGEPTRPRRISKRASKTPTKAIVRRSKRNRKISYLEERIPFDIIATIFKYSENINFVRASLVIGKFLSAIETRREVFVYAFAPTWCARGIMGDTKLGREPNPDFQSALLEFSWVDVRFISQSFARCVRMYPKFMEGRDIFGDLNLNLNPDDKDVKDIAQDDNAEVNSAERYFMDHYAAFMSEDKILDKPFLTRDIDAQINMVHFKTRIPDALITGPWDEEALKKFYWLIRAGIGYQPGQTWELAFQGLETALEHRDEPNGLCISAMVLLKHTISWLDWPAARLQEAQKLIYPLELKAAWTKKHSVYKALRSVRNRIEYFENAIVTNNVQD